MADALKSQNAKWGMNPAVEKNIELFRNDRCVAVVTGQQVGMLTGPCFSIYKALSAIKLAQELERNGILAIPVFWMETGDHDLREIDHVALLDATSQKLERVVMPFDPGISGKPVGALRLGPAVKDFLNGVRAHFPPASETGGELAQLIEACYQPQDTVADGFGRLMAGLLGQFGLVLMDPSDPRIARLSRPVFTWVLENCQELCVAVEDTGRRIAAAGYEPQIKIDAHSALLFCNEDGTRRLLQRQDHQVGPKGAGKGKSIEEYLDLIESQPELFSPSVVVRSLVQDFLLPTAIYVGGPTETSYLAELGGVYKLFGRPMPVIYPRASLTILTRKAERLLGKLGLEVAEIFLGEESVKSKALSALAPPRILDRFEELENALNSNLGALKPDLERVDSTLGGALENAQQKMLYQVQHLKTRFVHAEERHHQTLIQQIESLMNLIYPVGKPQERELNICSFLSRYGMGFLKDLLESVQINMAGHQVISVDQ